MQTKVELAEKVEQTARTVFGDRKLGDLLKRRGHWKVGATPTIKQAFANLGSGHFKFRVAGRDCPGADPEWKYDLIWFEDDSDGFTTRVPLILESELDPNVDPVDLDFVKLVDSRAEIRVWLSCAADPGGAEQHIANCERQVQRFAGTLPGDLYVFIIFDWATEGVTIKRFAAA